MEGVNGLWRTGARTGFTLFELVLVILVVTIAVSIVMPSFSGTLATVATRSSARRLMALSRRARAQAVAEGIRHRVNFDFDERQFWLTAESAPLSEPGVYREIEADWGQRLEVPDKVTLRRVVMIVEEEREELESGETHVTFSPDGTACDCEVVFEAADGFRCVVAIRGLTGRVRITDEAEL